MSADVFSKLEKLLDTNPEAFRKAVLRMQTEEPELFAAYVEHWRAKLSNASWATRVRRTESIRALFSVDTCVRRKFG